MEKLDGKIHDTGERVIYAEGSAQREPATGKGRPDLISPFATERLGKWYELGANKYGEYNWTKGMPFSRYLAALERHVIAFKKGNMDEDHLAAIAWNAFAIMHHQALNELEWDDLPKWKIREDE